MTIDFSIYRARLVALQEDCIAGSKSYPVFNIGASDPVHWLNILTPVTNVIQDTDTVTYTINIEAYLIRGGSDSGYNQKVEIQCQDDVFSVSAYFINDDARNMIVGAYTTPPIGYVPRSLSIRSEGVGEVKTDAGMKRSSRYTIAFRHHERR
jgi:hypothetical protein